MRGPTVKTQKSCYECEFCTSKHYAVQNDSGCVVDCVHPSFASPRQVGDTVWDTPVWCPEELIDRLPRLSEADEARLDSALAGESAANKKLDEACAAFEARQLALCKAAEAGFGVACIEPIDLEHEIRRGAERLTTALSRVAELEGRIEKAVLHCRLCAAVCRRPRDWREQLALLEEEL